MPSTLNFSPSTTRRFSAGAAMVHVRFAGESFDLALSSLDIGVTSTDSQIRRAVATTLMIPVERLDEHTIDRHFNGNLTIRPDAQFI